MCPEETRPAKLRGNFQLLVLRAVRAPGSPEPGGRLRRCNLSPAELGEVLGCRRSSVGGAEIVVLERTARTNAVVPMGGTPAVAGPARLHERPACS